MSQIVVTALYQFVTVTDLPELKKALRAFERFKDLKGTLIIAKEGINGTIAANPDTMSAILKWFQAHPLFDIAYKQSYCQENPFLRYKVKVKKEIVTIGDEQVDPNHMVGEYVSPKDWNQLIQDPDVLVIDTRNDYESKIGTFKGSILVNSSNFTEFPEWVKNNKKKIKNKKIAMFCTGGVRCEKASSYLMKNGFKYVFQLEGGIISYLKQTKNKSKNWIGECFVFDERVSITENLSKGNYDQCFACRTPINDQDKISEMFRKGISCPHCYDMTTTKQKRSFEERTKQISLAKKKRIKHLGS